MWIAYLCLCVLPPKSRVCIVCGPRQEIAEDLLNRFEGLFLRNHPEIYTELSKQGRTYAILNNVKVEVFASHNISGMRGLDNVKFIQSDESDFYPKFQFWKRIIILYQ